MKKENPKEPELRVLPDEQESVRLSSADVVAVKEVKKVEVLQPDREAKMKAKAFEPDIADILDTDEVDVDLEEAWGEGVKKTPPMGWFFLAGVALCALGLWAAVNVFKAQPDLEEVVDEKQSLTVNRLKEDKAVRQTLLGMEQCARGYLTAKSVQDKLRYVRHPDRVKPMLEAYYESHEMKSEDFRQFERMRSMGLENLSFVYGQVELFSGKKHQLLLEQLEDGSFRVDWESDVCYLPVDWADYLLGANKDAVVMRVFIKRDNFFAYEFSDEARYDSYMLTTRDADDHLFGFVEKGSEVAMDLKRFLKRVERYGSGGSEPLMLRLRFPKDTHSKKCVRIEALVSPRWTYVKSPEKE